MKGYSKYISSAEWYRKREERRMMDKSRCRTCGGTEQLECHHVSYEHFGDEPMEDLITLCAECHKAITNVIRGRRYSQRQYKVKAIEPEGELNHVERKRVHIEISVPDVDAQRPNGRSGQRVRKSYESYLREASQD